ncbi:MAG: aminopeptidase N C-terminal domain-containing protein, partial [Gammaproteobacteria bacterium]
ALTAVRQALLAALGDELQRVYRANAVPGPYTPDPLSIGKRSLRNVCLGYLCAGRDAAGLELALAQYRDADNMTDSLAALAQLAERDEPEARAALEAFQQHWKDDALVMDKWFVIQASADRPDALAHVQSLMEHPAFSMTNPNKVRSLVGAFAAMNPVHFHAADGGGYAFVADRIIELNGLNPQVAARMASPFTRWRRYTADRREHMRAHLERIAGIEGLSKDVNELVVKSLAED